MMLLSSSIPTAFAAPHVMPVSTNQVRFTPLTMSEPEVAPKAAVDTSTMVGVVVPTGAGADAISPDENGKVTTQEFIESPFGPARSTASTWNPQSLDVSKLPKFAGQFVPAYLKQTPAYL